VRLRLDVPAWLSAVCPPAGGFGVWRWLDPGWAGVAVSLAAGVQRERSGLRHCVPRRQEPN